MTFLTYNDVKSDKFYEVKQSGKTVTVSYGRVGAKAQTKTYDFEDTKTAKAQAQLLIDKKIKKGYVIKGKASTGKANSVSSAEQQVRRVPGLTGSVVTEKMPASFRNFARAWDDLEPLLDEKYIEDKDSESWSLVRELEDRRFVRNWSSNAYPNLNLKPRAHNEIDSKCDNFMGPVFTCAGYPWPRDGYGNPMIALCQLDLGKLSAKLNANLGNGLFQWFFEAAGGVSGVARIVPVNSLEKPQLATPTIKDLEQFREDYQTWIDAPDIRFTCPEDAVGYQLISLGKMSPMLPERFDDLEHIDSDLLFNLLELDEDRRPEFNRRMQKLERAEQKIRHDDRYITKSPYCLRLFGPAHTHQGEEDNIPLLSWGYPRCLNLERSGPDWLDLELFTLSVFIRGGTPRRTPSYEVYVDC